MNASLNEKLRAVKWGEYKLGTLFDIENTLSFNAEKLVDGKEYDYVTRTSINQGILQTTGFVNESNINASGTWSLGLLSMDFFYRRKPWYAGQFVRKIIPNISIPEKAVPFFSTILNKQKPILLSVLVRSVDEAFKNISIKLPETADGKIDFDFMESFIAELEAERVAELEAERVAELSAYLTVSGLDNYELSNNEMAIIERYKKHQIPFSEFEFIKIFNNIKQGRRLKKDDQLPGDIPFVMSGTTNTGVIGYISNPVARFPKNSITIDIFGNSFYRNYDFGAGDDTGVYWNTEKEYSRTCMLFFAAAMGRALRGKYSYGKKLRSSQSIHFKMQLPTKDGKPDYDAMAALISAVQKLVIKDVVLYADRKIEKTKDVTKR